ncbi:hypothetical protein AB1Y20_004295 [Prymnesium parvum]|uniref:RRM domain-containing protein n=1 Tax=Prymnesium parvum TaxID=97485 RepID=A0AB34IZU7_PRYPA
MHRVKAVERMNKKELAVQLKSDTVGNAGKWDRSKSWHAQYSDSAYVYVGGLPYDLTEGDIVIIFSQFGEVVDVNRPRDRKTGKPKGFAFIAYEDQRSTDLAVDNFNGAKLLGRTLSCDHCASYNEEQKKDVDNLPEHVTRRLNEQELARKRKEIELRNKELEEDNETKASTFATGRGTFESEEQLEERSIRQQIVQEKDMSANSKRVQHIEAVLAKRKMEAQAAATEEARKQQAWEERKRAKEREALAASIAMPPSAKKAPVVDEAREGAHREKKADSAEQRWERMMNGKSKKKARKEPPQASAPSGEDEVNGTGKDSVSVEETNRLRASLGMAPLRT